MFNYYTNKGITTDLIGVIAQWFKFDTVDIINVLDSYHGGNIKSTVKMVFDSKNIEIIKTNKDTITEDLDKNDKTIFWHGSPSGQLVQSLGGIHVGTYKAATDALEARIGIPKEGTWDGSREYGKTLLAGKKSLQSGKYGKYRDTGFNSDAPEEDYYPKDTKRESAKYGNGEVIPYDVKPIIYPIKIVGNMTNSIYKPMSDTRANATIKSMMKQGKAKNGYYYKNDAEDEGSISAVVPSKEHLKILEN
jgi:hypothetical protein